MSQEFLLGAESRADQGKGASRRLRLTGKVPAIIYGGKGEALSVQVSANELGKRLKNEAFYSSIITVNLDGKDELTVLKDLQRHPAKGTVLHLDLLRVVAGEVLRMHVPLHFKGEADSPGAKKGGVFQHQLIDAEVECMPQHLPESLEVDVSGMDIDDGLHLDQIQLPEGVKLVALMHEENPMVVSVHQPRVSAADEAADAADAADAAEGEAASKDEGEGNT